jgi:single-strand DNA-binding protein
MLTANVIGNLGSDAEMRYSTNGSPLLRCNVAVNLRVKEEGEWTEKTEWVRVTVFGARAESLSRFLVKGTKVYVSGRLEARPWTTKDGDLRAGLEIVAGDVELCSPRPAEDQRQPVAAVARQQQEDDGADLDSLPF